MWLEAALESGGRTSGPRPHPGLEDSFFPSPAPCWGRGGPRAPGALYPPRSALTGAHCARAEPSQ